MKYIVAGKIDVNKIDKDRLFKGEKGTYLNVTIFLDTDNKDQYDNNGMIVQSVSKEERENGMQGAILGNAKVFRQNNNQPQSAGSSQQSTSSQPSQNFDNFDDDIPF